MENLFIKQLGVGHEECLEILGTVNFANFKFLTLNVLILF